MVPTYARKLKRGGKAYWELFRSWITEFLASFRIFKRILSRLPGVWRDADFSRQFCTPLHHYGPATERESKEVKEVPEYFRVIIIFVADICLGHVEKN